MGDGVSEKMWSVRYADGHGRWCVVIGRGNVFDFMRMRTATKTGAKRIANRLYGHWRGRVRRWRQDPYKEQMLSK